MTDENPLPAGDLSERPLSLVTAVAETIWTRIHGAERSPLWFGPARGERTVSRFDDPLGEYRVCYFGVTPEASFAETFLRDVPVRILGRSALAARSLVRVRLTRDLRLVPLHGPHLAQLGVTAEVASGQSYRVSRAWSRMLWAHPDRPDGLLYHARHDDDAFCVALFDRASDALAVVETRSLLHDPELLGRLLNRYRLGLTS